jgi:Mce-associated membrane protein
VVTALTVVLAATPAAAQPDPVTGPDNHALIDAAATSDLLDTAKEISTQLFTYSYTDLKGHEKKFAELTTGEFSKKYAELFSSVDAQASTMRLTVTSTVKDAGVRLLTDRTAQVLVFIDQTSARGDTGQSSTAGAAFLATFSLVGGTWKASDIDIF